MTEASERRTGEPDRLVLVGLTGGIGSGKSTVGRMVRALGVPVLDADHLARQVVEPGQPAHAEIAAAWPQAVGPDGRLDRGALASIVFADRDARARLESITHPRIREAARQAAEALRAAGHRLAFYEASMLIEAGRQRDFDEIVVVRASQPTQIARAVARGEQGEAQILARLAAQLPIDEKLTHATFVIDNEGDLASTERQVADLVAALRARYGPAASGAPAP